MNENSSEETQQFSPSNHTTTSASVSQPITSFGEYQIEQEIARGGMGVVYRARQTSLNRTVALKMILSGKLAGPEDIRRFHVEAEAAAKLDHPNIVPIYDIGELDGQHFFTMGFIDGGSLDRLLIENTLHARTAVEMMVQVADAIQYAHDRHIIHRDLKPANILLAKGNALRGSTLGSSQGALRQKNAKSSAPKVMSPNPTPRGASSEAIDQNWIPKVSDFGLAKHVGSQSELTGTGQILGTPSYMPPEQAAGNNDSVGAAADIYSLGAILYRALTGRPPFQAASTMETILQVLRQDPVPPRQLNPTIPSDLETICLKCLQKDPAKRYVTALELREDLQRWLNGDPIRARPMSGSEKVSRWIRRHPAITSTVAVVMAALAVIVGVLASTNSRLTKQRDIAIQATVDADAQRRLAESRLKRAMEAVEKTLARVASDRWAMDPELQTERRAILEDAIGFYNGLIADESDSTVVRWEAAKAYETMAGAKFILNDMQGSRDSCEKSIALCDALLQEEPGNVDYLSRKSTVLMLQGIVTALSSNAALSVQKLEESVALCKEASAGAPDRLDFQTLTVEAMSYYAYFCLAGDAQSKATGQATLPDTIARARKLNSYPNVPMEGKLALAFALNVTSGYQLNANRINESRAGYAEALSIVEQIKDMSAPDARRADNYLHVRALSLLNLGLCDVMTGSSNGNDGWKNFNAGIEQLRSLIRIHPQALVYKLQLMQALRAKSASLTTLQKADEASLANQEISLLLQQMVKENPDQAWLQTLGFADASVKLVEQLRDGQLDGFPDSAERMLTNLRPNSRDIVTYNIACAYSIATKLPSLDAPTREKYAQRALDLLIQLGHVGYFNDPKQLAHARSDEDLQPIRAKIDWELILKPEGK